MKAKFADIAKRVLTKIGTCVRFRPPEAVGAKSVRDPSFRERAYDVIERHGEALVAYYAANSCGWTEWHLVRTRAELDTLLVAGTRRSMFDLYLTPQLPIRAVADHVSEAATMTALRAHGEVLMAAPAGPETVSAKYVLAVATCLDTYVADEESEVHEWFAEHRGASILAGPHPLCLPADIVLTARVPDRDGKVRHTTF